MQISRTQANLVILACAAIWGSAFLFQKAAMSHMGPLLFVAMRCLIAAIALAPLAVLEARSHTGSPPAAIWASTAAAGVLLFIAMAMQQIGLMTAPVTETAFLTALYVVATPLAAWAIMKRRPSAAVWAAVAMSFAGTWLLGGGGYLAAFGVGEALTASATIFWALHVVVLGLAAPLGRPILLSAGQFAIAAALALAGAAAFENIELAAIAAASVDILFVGLLSSALTFTLFTIALRGTSPTEAVIIASTEALFAAAAAAYLLGERLSALGIAGAALILAAVLVVQLAPQGRARA